ncbi:hypothetical protein GQX73_g6433 [Xylaria multiplex]|uniref:Uncharacterized protein n=1 Tax=Xylaria multiplex TaxID=323545 RepID=A0A7C8MRT6_9PEZI|nr:hypothetical protein GQX73_g6433 [Xylaria multiplex]
MSESPAIPKAPADCASVSELINWVRDFIFGTDFEDWKSTLTQFNHAVAYTNNRTLTLYAMEPGGPTGLRHSINPTHLVDFTSALQEQARQWEGGLNTPKTQVAFSKIWYKGLGWHISYTGSVDRSWLGPV